MKEEIVKQVLDLAPGLLINGKEIQYDLGVLEYRARIEKELPNLISQVVQNTVEALRTQMLGDAFFKQCDGCSCDAKEVIKQHCALFLKDITKEE